MKHLTTSAIALSFAVLGFANGAQAQEAKKLFFEGDIVTHALAGQQGPFCLLKNQYKRGEAVAFRIRVMMPDGKVADANALKSVQVELGNGTKLPARYGGHGMPPTDFFWSLFWTVPDDFPTGSLGYKSSPPCRTAAPRNGSRSTATVRSSPSSRERPQWRPRVLSRFLRLHGWEPASIQWTKAGFRPLEAQECARKQRAASHPIQAQRGTS